MRTFLQIRKEVDVFLRLFYNLPRCPISEIIKMVKFVGLDMVLDEERLMCTLQNSEGHYHREELLEKIPFPISTYQV